MKQDKTKPKVVIDTNILVSSLLSKDGVPAKLIYMVLNNQIIPCFDFRIIEEYKKVLKRPKFGFTDSEINDLIGAIENIGYIYASKPINIPFIDESDKKFYEILKISDSILITGNIKHYPKDNNVMTVNEFLMKFE